MTDRSLRNRFLSELDWTYQTDASHLHRHTPKVHREARIDFALLLGHPLVAFYCLIEAYANCIILAPDTRPQFKNGICLSSDGFPELGASSLIEALCVTQMFWRVVNPLALIHFVMFDNRILPDYRGKSIWHSSLFWVWHSSIRIRTIFVQIRTRSGIGLFLSNSGYLIDFQGLARLQLATGSDAAFSICPTLTLSALLFSAVLLFLRTQPLRIYQNFWPKWELPLEGFKPSSSDCIPICTSNRFLASVPATAIQISYR